MVWSSFDAYPILHLKTFDTPENQSNKLPPVTPNVAHFIHFNTLLFDGVYLIKSIPVYIKKMFTKNVHEFNTGTIFAPMHSARFFIVIEWQIKN